MWEDLSIRSVIVWLVAPALVAGALGLLRRSRLRTGLIYALGVLPLLLIALIGLLIDGAAASLFLLLMLWVVWVPYCCVVALSYNFVRHFRDRRDDDAARLTKQVFE